MPLLLAATASGCRTFTAAGAGGTELAGRAVSALAPGPGGTCAAVVDDREVWQRDPGGGWSRRAATELPLQSLVPAGGDLLAGGLDEAAILRIRPSGAVERLGGFDAVPGRREWFASGPPLGVRSLAATADGSALLAAVHVGGIPRSADGGTTWTPTLPIGFDVHEVRAHPAAPNLAVAAAAVGLCVSEDAGLTWRVLAEGLEITNSLAVAVVDDQVLFSLQNGPQATCSQVWRWRMGGRVLEPVREGLPPWLEGKVDTAKIAAGGGRAAIADQGGNLWLSRAGTQGWSRLATGLPYVFGLAILPDP